ncbi:MAG: 4Fe-4S binding protein [Methanomassiliicoccus sp.]|nr:4Fe-4S binding protein [Methanomassiliicoccus sp.]
MSYNGRGGMGIRTNIASKIIKGMFKHRFLMAHTTRVPALGRAVEFAFFDKDEMIYLPRDSAVTAARTRTIELGTELGRTDMVLPSQVIEHFLRRSKYIFIMNRCTCRDSNRCEHYPHELGCVFLGAGVTKILPEMGRMVTADEAIEHMRMAREKGLVHLIGRNKIDSIWLNTGPKEDLLSICNCCECCCLWKMLPQLSDSISNGVSKMPGVRVMVTDRCSGCERCIREEICFVRAVSLANGRASIDQTMCRGCGRCVELCPSKAIELEIDIPDYVERSVQAINPLVDIEKE